LESSGKVGRETLAEVGGGPGDNDSGIRNYLGRGVENGADESAVYGDLCEKARSEPHGEEEL
jgi:hypothetical protein